MKKIVSSLLILSFLLLGGCYSKPTLSVSEQFLAGFYTASNIEAIQKSLQKLESSSLSEDDTAQFHKPLAELMTKKGLAGIIANRNYININKMALDGDVTLEPTSIKLDEREGSTSFSLTVKITSLSDGTVKEIKQEGQILLSDTGKIDGVSFANLGELQQ